MKSLSRRTTFTRIAAAAIAVIGFNFAALPVAQAETPTKIKFVLQWKFEGSHAWFFVAQDKGYFKEEGLEVHFDQGVGSAASIPKVASGAYDAGFGDLNAIIDMAAKRPAEAPVGVYMLYNTPPFTLVVKKNSPIKTPKDLEGKTIGGPANDGALKLFPAFAKLTQIDASKVNVSNMAPNLREQMLVRGQIDAAFGYVNTITFGAKGIGIDANKDLRFIRYGDYGMDLYANTVFFDRKFIQEKPKAVEGFVRALNRAIKDVMANPEMGMDAVMQREPLLKRDVETERLQTALKNDMSHPEITRIGLGNVDNDRLKRSIDILVSANDLPRTPTPDEVFNSSFLPPLAERPTKF